ncbi:hypothetical protein ACOSQ4_015811 [Xanthoceras sorbifolium]
MIAGQGNCMVFNPCDFGFGILKYKTSIQIKGVLALKRNLGGLCGLMKTCNGRILFEVAILVKLIPFNEGERLLEIVEITSLLTHLE